MDLNKCYEESVLLIGPMCSGKTSVLEPLLAKLYKETNLIRSLSVVKTDLIFPEFLKKTSYSYALHKKLERHSEMGAFRYLHKFTLEHTFHFLENMRNPMLIEFGGLSTLPLTSEERKRLKRAFLGFKNVVLLLPVKDKNESHKILRERWINSQRKNSEFLNLINEEIVNDSLNEEVSTIIIYTEGLTFDEIAEEIKNRVKENRYCYVKKGDENK